MDKWTNLEKQNKKQSPNYVVTIAKSMGEAEDLFHYAKQRRRYDVPKRTR